MNKVVLALLGAIVLLLGGCAGKNDSFLSPSNEANICYFMEFHDDEGYTTSYLGVPPNDWEPNYKEETRSTAYYDFTKIVINLNNDKLRAIKPSETTIVIENAYPSEYINMQLGNFFDLSNMTRYVVKTLKSTGHQLVWNGCNEEGEICPTGFYKYTIYYDDRSSSDFALLIDQDGIPGWDPEQQK